MMLFLLFSSALALLAVALLTRRLWWRQRATAVAAALPRPMGLVALLGIFVIVFAATGYAIVGSPHWLSREPATVMLPQGAISEGQDATIIERILRLMEI